MLSLLEKKETHKHTHKSTVKHIRYKVPLLKNIWACCLLKRGQISSKFIMCCHSGTAATQPLELSAVPVEHFSGYLLRRPMAATTSQLLSQNHWSWTGRRYALRHASDRSDVGNTSEHAKIWGRTCTTCLSGMVKTKKFLSESIWIKSLMTVPVAHRREDLFSQEWAQPFSSIQ